MLVNTQPLLVVLLLEFVSISLVADGKIRGGENEHENESRVEEKLFDTSIPRARCSGRAQTERSRINTGKQETAGHAVGRYRLAPFHLRRV